MTMELEDQDATFNSTQFLADYLSADFRNEETFNNFMQTINTNVGYFASLTRTDSENFFSQFSAEVVAIIHASLAETVLVHLDLKSQLKAKDNLKEEPMYKDIYEFCQLLVADQNSIQSYDLSKLFSKVSVMKPKNISNFLEENLKILINEVKELKRVINTQNKSIDQIKTENKNMKDELMKVTKILESGKPINSNLFNAPFPPLIANKPSTSASVNHTPLRGGPSFAQAILNNGTNSPTLSTSQGTKRTLENKNKNPSKIAKPTPKNQKEIKSFDSFNPNSKNKPIDLTKDDGYRLAGKKFNKKKPTVKSQYAKIIGRDESNLLSAKPKQFYIYLGQLDMSVDTNKVKDFLDKKLKGVKFDDDNTRDVKYDNLKEINTDKENRTFKSFSFSVSVLDKDIIDNKSLWPLYSIVNKFKLSHAEWTKISEKFNKKPITSNVSSQNGQE